MELNLAFCGPANVGFLATWADMGIAVVWVGCAILQLLDGPLDRGQQFEVGASDLFAAIGHKGAGGSLSPTPGERISLAN